MESPKCPKCHSKMVLRTATRGKNAGGRFYGCSRYPKCKETLEYNPSEQNDATDTTYQADTFRVDHSYPRTLVARSRIQGHHVRFYESAALPKNIFDTLRELEILENSIRTFSQWRLDFPKATKTPQWPERERQVLSVVEKILTRGKITICSPLIEEELNKLFGPIDNSILKNGINVTQILASCQSDSLTPWLDSAVETKFFQELLPVILGSAYFRWVLPQVDLSSLIPTNTSQPTSGRVDFFLHTPNGKSIIIEIDGEQHNNQEDADRQRDALLAQYGFNVVRIPAQEVTAGVGPNIAYLDKIVDKSFNISNESVMHNALLVKVIYASRHIHQIQLALLQAIQTGHIGLLNSDEWIIFSDLEKTGIYTKIEAKKVLAIAVKDLADLFVRLGHLYSIDLCQGKPHICSDSSPSNHSSSVNISFTGKAANGRTNFYIQHISVPFDIANSVFITSPAILDKPKRNDLEYFLRYIFRKEAFWEGQFDAISRTLEGKDSIVLLPTGGGKSIAFQLASFLLPGRSVVIDPIVSLMDDQIDNLGSMGIDRCIAITSQIENVEDKNRAIALFGQGEYFFAYIAPERFQTVDFRDSLRSLTVHTPVALIAVDEAHCISEWGHDFRTAYLNIGRISRQYCESNLIVPPILALTGTASRAVLKDVQRELQIDEFEAIITPKSFDRPELKFHIFHSRSSEKSARLIGMLSQMLPGTFSVPVTTFYGLDGARTYSGLVFCPHVNGEYGVVHQAEEIRKAMGIYADFYSGSQPKLSRMGAWTSTKKIVARKFKNNQIPLLVCTKAFGMGIDKPNIRYTVHFGIPPSIEAFYQEAGRAGRDRHTAHCCIIVSDDDPQRTRKLLDPNTKAEEIAMAIDSLNWQDNDDITRALYFQSKAFPGVETEKSRVLDVIKKLGEVSTKRDCKIAYPKDERAVHEKALHRLLLLGIVSDYTINYSTSEFTVRLSGITKQQMVESYGIYVAGYIGSRKQVELDKAQKLLGLPINDFITQILDLLLRFIYDIIEKGRRRALQEMLLAATVSQNDAAIRQRILRYLEATEYSEILDAIIHESEAGISKTINTFENVRSPNDASELRGQVSRYLESYPDHPGLLMLRALSEAYTRDHNYTLVQQNLYASLTSCIENYGVDKNRMYLFAAWAVSHIARRESQHVDHLLKTLLNVYSERAFAKALVSALPRAHALIPAWFMLDNTRKAVEKILTQL